MSALTTPNAPALFTIWRRLRPPLEISGLSPLPARPWSYSSRIVASHSLYPPTDPADFIHVKAYHFHQTRRNASRPNLGPSRQVAAIVRHEFGVGFVAIASRGESSVDSQRVTRHE